MRQHILPEAVDRNEHFPSFLEGLSLRQKKGHKKPLEPPHFPSFLEGLSLRHPKIQVERLKRVISLPFWRGFH